MKRFILFSLAGFLTLAVCTAKAAPLIPGGTVTPVPSGDAAGSLLADTGVLPYSFGGGTQTGTVRELVVADSSNPFGAGDLSFLYQVHVTTGDIARITGGSYDSFLTDVTQFAAHPPFITTGTHVAVLADRDVSGQTVGFNFDPLISPDAGTTDTSLALIVRTNATTFVPGFIGVIDTGAAQLSGFVPGVPEPASILLLAVGGGAGMLGYGRKKRPTVTA